MITSLRASLFAATILSVAAPALAADLPSRAKAPVLATQAASPWQIRLRALAVVPTGSLSLDQDAAADAKISNSVVPEVDISYYFTKNIAAELVLGVTPHTVTGTSGSIAGARVGKTTLLPPTLTMQYHFTDFGALQPYVGAGVNYTFFLDTKDGAATNLKIKSAPGAALQVGFDYMLDANWGVNVDVKKLWLRPDVTATGLTGNLRIDPWLIGTGATYRF